MESTRFLIVNADDFGLSDGVNQGIIEAHERRNRHKCQSDGTQACRIRRRQL